MKRLGSRWTLPAAIAAGLAAAAPVAAQTESARPGSDSLRLGVLHQAAVAQDPRQRQFQLLASRTSLRLRNLSAERFPSITAGAQAQYQSDVFEVPGPSGGAGFPSPTRDTYDSRISLEQPIVDPTIGPRRKVEAAALAESEARLRASLFGLREEVNEAFFSAALLNEREAIVAATIVELEQRLGEARARVREGASLPSDTAAIQATLLERQQDQSKIAADRMAALNRLMVLTGQPIAPTEPVSLPDLAAAVLEARRGVADVRARPEYLEFARMRERLTMQEDVAASALRPQLSAFGRVGYGQPGLNPVGDTFDTYYVAGLQVRWAPWNWGSTRRDRQALELEREIVATEEAAFSNRLTRAVQQDLAAMDRLDGALVLDDRIVTLREGVERESRLRFQEGVITASEYLDRSTETLQARLARATHMVEQVMARARFLTTLGVEIR
jgi:outer membrane protein TolC